MTSCLLIAILPAILDAWVEPVPRYPVAPVTAGSVRLAAGSGPVRGLPPPARPRGRSFLLGVIGSPDLAVAHRTPSFRPTSTPDADYCFEVVFFARTRPVHLRVLIETDGQPLTGRWRVHQRKLFDLFDRDQDGFLNGFELEHAIPVSGLRQILIGDHYTRASSPPPKLAELDRDQDARVSPAEFEEYYRAILPDLVRVRAAGSPSAVQDAGTNELFAQLDGNKDGKLTRSELAGAEEVFLRLDEDEDECISLNELLAGQLRATPPAAVRMAAGPVATPTAGPRDVAVHRTRLPANLGRQLLRRYDRNADGHLTRDECAFPPATLQRLDRDSSGALTAEELDAWGAGPPDRILTLRYSDDPANCRVTALDSDTWPTDWAVRQVDPNRLVLRIGSQTLDFNANTVPRKQPRQQQMTFATFFAPDVQFVEDKDIGGPENQFVRVVFDDADFNGDGRLTRQEFDRYFAVQRETADLGLALSHVIRTPNLFQLLDENGDGKLGVREMRTAWDRLASFEPAQDGAITRQILQPSATFRLTTTSFATLDSTAFQRMSNATSRRGPIWFVRMDRNGDGDVSPGEFLGDAAAFKLLDADGDRLISRDEALRYDKRVRPQTTRKQGSVKKK